VRRTALAVSGTAVLFLVIVLLPELVVDHDLGGAHIPPQDRLSATNNTRATLLQTVGGLVLLYGGYVGWRQLRISQDTLRTTQEGHLTDRFGRAVEQLGSDKPAVRIGGLHALWRIAEQSPEERDAVISIQAAYLRTRLRWPPTDPDAPPADASIGDVAPLEERAADAQVALTGLGVLSMERRARWVNLSRIDLRLADCDGLWLTEMSLAEVWAEGAGFYHTNFTLSALVGATLRRCDMRTAILVEARCVGADFRGSNMVHCDLRRTIFNEADMRESILRKADARGAVFDGADLRRADLRGTDLHEASLEAARLEGAQASDVTRWPEGFDWAAAGVVLAADPGPEPGPLAQPVGISANIGPLQSLP
jgi:hypothetical protein